MRKGTRWAALGLCLCLLCGLWGCGGRELYERLLIHGIGVDAAEDGFVVTVRSSTSPEEEGEEFFRCQGRSVLEALNSLTLRTGRKPFYAHNYLVVFGEECARQGLNRCLDFFIRYYNTRPGVRLYLAKGKAEEVLGFQKDGVYEKMGELQQLGDSSRDNGRTVSVELLDFVNGVKREGSSAVLPVLQVGEEGIEIASTAYFDGYRLKGFLTLEETRGWLAVKERIDAGEAVVSGESFGSATLSLSGGSGTIEAGRGEDGTPSFLLRVTLEGDISALSGGRDQLGPSLYGELEKALAALLEEEVRGAVERAVIRDRCDIFGFGNLLYRTDPAYWRGAAGEWKELMARCGYQITVEAKVQRLEH